jgi:trigger factor
VKSDVETLNPTRVKLTVEVPYEELEPSLAKAYKTISAQVTVPGFRKGKVPPRIIDQRFGRGAVLEEAVNDALPHFYAQAVEAGAVRPLGQPTVEVEQVPMAQGDPLKFTAEVDVRPVIDLPDLSSIALQVDDVEVTDADVDERVEQLRERFGTLVSVERVAAEGDFTSVDLIAAIGDDEIDSVKGVSYQLGSGTMLPGIDEALLGLSAGETTTFDAPLAGGDHAGSDAHVTVTLQAVKERRLPELNDEFAELYSEFDTLDELRADLREQAGNAKRFDQGLQAREKLVEHLLETVEVAVPEGIVADEVNRHLEGEGKLEDDEHRGEVEVEARKTFQAQLLLDAIAEAEQVQVGQPELIEYLLSSAQQFGMDPNSFIKMVDEAGQIPSMVSEVARRKALAGVLSRATVTDASGHVVDLSTLWPTDDEITELGAPDDEPVAASPSVRSASAPVVASAAADPTAVPLSDLAGFEPDPA